LGVRSLTGGQLARPPSHQDLRRFWFPLSMGLGIGVTAGSPDEARALAEDVRAHYYPNSEITGEIADVDVSLLDPMHVVPNLGFVVAYGVWFPALNTQG
jgi:hypothetical protein